MDDVWRLLIGTNAPRNGLLLGLVGVAGLVALVRTAPTRTSPTRTAPSRSFDQQRLRLVAGAAAFLPVAVTLATRPIAPLSGALVASPFVVAAIAGRGRRNPAEWYVLGVALVSAVLVLSTMRAGGFADLVGRALPPDPRIRAGGAGYRTPRHDDPPRPPGTGWGRRRRQPARCRVGARPHLGVWELHRARRRPRHSGRLHDHDAPARGRPDGVRPALADCTRRRRRAAGHCDHPCRRRGLRGGHPTRRQQGPRVPRAWWRMP